MRFISALALTVGFCCLAGPGYSQEAKPATKAQVLFGQFKDVMNEGRFDVAANFLQAFMEANPTDEDLLEIEKRYSMTVFQSLRNVKWSDDATAYEKAKKNVATLVERSQAANAKLLYNPTRVAKYIRNLGATYEEKVFAELELKRTGDYAVPFMVEELRITREGAIKSGIIECIGLLNASTMSGWVAALDALPPDLQYSVIANMATRDDFARLQASAQTDLTAFLWKQLASPAGQNTALRELAEKLINRIHRGARADSKLPEVEITAIARTFYDHTALFSNPTNPGSSTVPLWVWDERSAKLIKLPEVSRANAEEYYGLRYLRWVLEFKPTYEPAQGLLLSLAAEKAIERARFGNLAKAEPAVYRMLSDAPSRVLIDLLERGLGEKEHKRTSLVLAMIQVLGDRSDRDVATPPAGAPGRPSLLVRALSYPDPQVQFAAANALLRSPVPVPGSVKPLIVEILRRALGNPGAPEGTTGTALLADPNRARADSTAAVLRGLGYYVEVVTTGRDLLRRISKASDFDLIMIDHHTPNPELIDLVGQISADTKTANRPTFIVASSDKPHPPTYDQMLVRLAVLIAATENDKLVLPVPFVPNPLDKEKPEADIIPRKDNQNQRDRVLHDAGEARMARLQRLVDTTGLELTDTQKILLKLKIELLTFAILQLQYPFSADSAPQTVDHLERIRRQFDSQPLSPLYGTGAPTTALMKLVERFDLELARVPPRKAEFETLYTRIDPKDYGIIIETFREPLVEARLGSKFRSYPNIRIIPEPYAGSELAAELRASYQDPAQAPRDPIEKKASQKAAIEWFRKMAVGDVPGYDIKTAEAEIREALKADDLAEYAIDAAGWFSSPATQEALLSVALSGMRPLPLRIKAADATIKHIQTHGKATSKTLIDSLVALSATEPDLILRGKFATLKGMLAFMEGDFLNQLKTYNPPIIPPPPAAKDKEPAKDPPPQ